MRYFLILVATLGLSLLFASTALAKPKHNPPKGKALGLAKQELKQTGNSSGNRGAVWTTNSTGSQQNQNHYQSDEGVYLHGQKLPTGTLSYTIYTNPPSAKKGTAVATGTVNVDENGQLSPTIIWTISQSASSGIYKIVLSTGSHKSDNFKIVAAKLPQPEPEPEEKPPVSPPPPTLAKGGAPTVAQAQLVKAVKKLPAAGPNHYQLLFLTALTIGLSLALKRFLFRKI